MEDIEIPQYFICPISLQIMKDPVTAITGITYDRESIEHWIFQAKNTTCPVTKQPLLIPTDHSSDLTPNHTLRRLIQSWCTQNAVDRIPTPKPPLTKCNVVNLVKDLRFPNLQLKTLRKLEFLAIEHERNRKCMVEAGVHKAMASHLVNCHEKNETTGIEEALSIFNLVPSSSSDMNVLVSANDDRIIEALVWVLGLDVCNFVTVKSHAVLVLKTIIGKASSSVLERLKPGFFKTIVGVLKQGISQQGINAALQIMLDTSPWGRNKITLVESGAVFELIELELSFPEKKTTELVLGILFHLCSCADGREQLMRHAAGIAVVTKQLLKVSPTADDRAMLVLSLVCRFSSGSYLVSQEMLKVGTFTKLCIVLQGDSPSYLKDKAKEILRAHYDVWKDSPCIEVTTL
ncbi:hypothetical protein Vadar_000066 [Vaccinium darrowii]|uniref:Uncharacterized protein n=1 Tax=Vaccinium darrowii TaxID=229202 RepID=A0ACB7XME8_9ERIC|nr:hypothetical protein Vadar_000066 [Vaccinium darrowii]